MCGIAAYVGERAAQPLLLDGLQRLEYRGYDSAGISLAEGDTIQHIRAVGNLSSLRTITDRRPQSPATSGIGHTRWATHGRVEERNAHPHTDTSCHVHIVLNGIVENHRELRRRLELVGAVFRSETDAEVVAHLIASHYRGRPGSLLGAVAEAYREMEGHYAFVALSAHEPQTLVAARHRCPLVIGRGDGEQFVASEIPAFLKHTRAIQHVEDDELVLIRPDQVSFYPAYGEGSLAREITQVDWELDTAEKGGYETFMLKEIYEQPGALRETLGERLTAEAGVDISDLGGLDIEKLNAVDRLTIVACGTSYHAALIGRYALETWARIPVNIDISSEFRYRDPVIDGGDLVIGISQSGETADTLAALALARARGAHTLAITNVMGSQITRETDGVLYTRAGLEMGVAATKTFVAQVAVLCLLALHMARVRGSLADERLWMLEAQLAALPDMAAEALEATAADAESIARDLHENEFFLYLGRHVGLPVALEGALKLKEISYIATDAYAAGEMKHGPIALLSDQTPVLVVATDGPATEKTLSNMAEVRARGAYVVALVSQDYPIGDQADRVIRVPRADGIYQAVLATLPLQLIAYYIAKLRGNNVDQPRNLAKTVTVE